MSYSNYGNSFQRNSPIVFNIIVINVLVFLIQMLFDGHGPVGVITNKLAIHHYTSQYFEPYQVVTNMFAHGGIAHIFFNMFTLYVFGVWLERVWGPKRFLIFYLICGVVAGLAQMMFLKDEIVYDPSTGQTVVEIGSALGASGAIMGLMGAFAYLFPNTELILLFPPIPIKAKYLVGVYAAIDLFGGLSGGNADNIGHYAHLGGLIMGLILVIYWNKTNKRTFY
ncbi:MAG: rhomboid family intramembrane serine protease [Bacteroidetes bacterium]|nr:rhomboid family intramembrane serine protease [Bacteroidota bacterium]